MIDSFINFVKESKYRELCMAVSYAIRPSATAFRNKLRGYFSNQQKEVIKNIKANNVSINYFYDVQKYIDKLVSIYVESLTPTFMKGIKRGESESNSEADDVLINYLKDRYITEVVNLYVSKIEQTTIEKLTSYYKKYLSGEWTKDQLIEKINEFYNSDCKGWRSKEIALTESYRAFNWAYFTYMVIQGYYYKKYIACFNFKDSKSKYIHGQIKFYLEPFCIPYEVIKDDENCGLIPPLHPNSRATIIMLKDLTND